MSAQGPCYINSIPSEIVSEILLGVIDGFGENIRLKWRFPLLVRRVSKRFYHITNNTRFLWRYLYIRHPLHPYLQTHISRSAPLSLVVDAKWNTDTVERWRDVIDLILPTFPRLASLIFQSPYDNTPIRELLRHEMPVLGRLDVQGRMDRPTRLGFSLSRIPGLRYLHSVDGFLFNAGMKLPETLEELHIGSEWNNVYSSESLWNSLPKRLRGLRVEGMMLGGTNPRRVDKILLPCLNELHFVEHHYGEQPSILPFLDAPCLHTLTIESTGDNLSREPDFAAYPIDFPMLTHLEWRLWYNLPVLALTLKRCNALKSLFIKARWNSIGLKESMLDFAETLARETSLLPLLEDVLMLGAPLPSLRNLVHARPRLRRLEMHRSDLRPDLSSEWMPTHIEFCINRNPTFWPR